jgi:hypothetical protein
MRNTSTTTDSTTRRPRQVLAAVRDELRERREARRAYRDLARDLASYNTRAEVDDLLAALDNDQSPEAVQIRTILSSNLNRNAQGITKHPLAS